MSDYLVDCNHLSAALRKVSPVREKMQQERRDGRRLITCYPVLCELEVAIQQTLAPEENRRRLGHLLRQVKIWHLDSRVVGVGGPVMLMGHV